MIYSDPDRAARVARALLAGAGIEPIEGFDGSTLMDRLHAIGLRHSIVGAGSRPGMLEADADMLRDVKHRAQSLARVLTKALSNPARSRALAGLAASGIGDLSVEGLRDALRRLGAGIIIPTESARSRVAFAKPKGAPEIAEALADLLATYQDVTGRHAGVGLEAGTRKPTAAVRFVVACLPHCGLPAMKPAAVVKAHQRQKRALDGDTAPRLPRRCP